jgi:hypothetical protein
MTLFIRLFMSGATLAVAISANKAINILPPLVTLCKFTKLFIELEKPFFYERLDLSKKPGCFGQSAIGNRSSNSIAKTSHLVKHLFPKY